MAVFVIVHRHLQQCMRSLSSHMCRWVVVSTSPLPPAEVFVQLERSIVEHTFTCAHTIFQFYWRTANFCSGWTQLLGVGGVSRYYYNDYTATGIYGPTVWCLMPSGAVCEHTHTMYGKAMSAADRGALPPLLGVSWDDLGSLCYLRFMNDVTCHFSPPCKHHTQHTELIIPHTHERHNRARKSFMVL